MADTRITTAPIWLVAARRLPDWAKVGAFALCVLAIELVLARSLTGPGVSRVVLLFGAVLLVAFVFRFPMATTLLFLGFTDFIFHSTFFNHEVGSLSVRPHEIALAILLAVAVVRPLRRSWGGAGGIALALFLALIGLSGAMAIGNGQAPLTDVFNAVRSFVPLTLFYVIVRLFPRAEQRRNLLVGATVIAALAALVSIGVALGWSLGDALKGEGTQIVREEEGLPGLLRVRLAGLSLGYALFWYVTVRVAGAAAGRRLGWAATLVAIAGGIAVSFNRNMWIGLFFGLALMLVLGGPFVRARLVTAVAVGLVGIAVLATVGSTTESRVLDPVVKRGATLFSPQQVSQESSLTDREQETRIAWRTAQDNLALGVGPGVPFGVSNLEFVGPRSVQVEPQLFLHNQYLYLLLIGGIPGLAAFLFFLVAPIIRSATRLPRDPAVLALGVGLATIMVSSVVAIYFSVEDMTAVLGMLAGVIVADRENETAEGLESGLS